jgi:hypothetical protein
MIELCRLLEPPSGVVHIHLMPFLGGIIEGEGETLRLCEHIVFLQFDKLINLVFVCVLKAQNVAYSFQQFHFASYHSRLQCQFEF